jgi:hypothetical protein
MQKYNCKNKNVLLRCEEKEEWITSPGTLEIATGGKLLKEMSLVTYSDVILEKEDKEDEKDAEFLSTIGHSLAEEGGKFKVNNKWLFLTYSKVATKHTDVDGLEIMMSEKKDRVDFSDFTDEDKLRKEFEKLSRNACKPKNRKGVYNEITQFNCALEYHKDGIPHFHVTVSYDKPIQTASSRFFDVTIDGTVFHPYIVRVKGYLDFNRLCQYISKEDKVIQAKESMDRSRILKQIWSADSVAEAWALVGGFQSGLSVNEIKTLWEDKGAKEIKNNFELPNFGWYKTIFEIIKKETTEHREVHWFCEKVGNLGKSALSYHLGFNKKASIIKCVGRMADFTQCIKNEIKMGWDFKVLILDIPRNYKDRNTIYEALECIKDGVITCTKYNSETIWLPRKPVVIVTANWWPQFTKMSIDRWKCYSIDNVDTCTRISTIQAMREAEASDNDADPDMI